MKFVQHVLSALEILVANVRGLEGLEGRNSLVECPKTYSYIVLSGAHATQSDTMSVQKTNEDTRGKSMFTIARVQ